MAALSLGLLAPAQTLSAATNTAKLQINGLGWLGGREMKRTINLLQGQKKAPQLYDANFVEDAALILMSKLTRDGYLQPRIEATLTLSSGVLEKFEWDEELKTILPRPLQVERIRFRIRRGIRFYYKEIEFTGLSIISAKKAKNFFVETDLLVPIKSTMIYTPSRLTRALGALKEAAARQGFAEASAIATHLNRDDRTGAVRVRVEVQEGLPTIVRSVRIEVQSPNETNSTHVETVKPGKPYSQPWVQDFTQSLRTNQYHRGFPDATAEISTLKKETLSTNHQVDLLAVVRPGPNIVLGELKFEGRKRTRQSVLRSRVQATPGKELNRVEIEHGRDRLVGLGVFDSVQVRYDQAAPRTRDVVYELKEGKTIDVSLLFGYGSYELLRGGIDLEKRNLWGLAHQARLRAVQSFKSSSANFLYTLPDLLRENVNLFFNASGLRREEIGFVREEYGGGVGLQRFVPFIESDVSLRYNYQVLNASDAEPGKIVGLKEARVAAWLLDVKHDRRDNPLLPRKGYKLFSLIEIASAALGGEVDYQRIELGTSYHQRLGGGRFLHLGLSHGVIATLGGREDELPFNKRFFPGGESSVRGYQQGEAAPRNADGEIVGAETYLQANVEFEQVLTPSWSLVCFVDGVGFAQSLRQYPASEALYSAGGGLRWKTLIGPARLEYGYNLNPRRHDPRGTIHFSLGFPF